MIAFIALLIDVANLKARDDLACQAAEHFSGTPAKPVSLWPSELAERQPSKQLFLPPCNNCGKRGNDTFDALPFSCRELPEVALSASAAGIGTVASAAADADSGTASVTSAAGVPNDPAALVQAPLPLSEDDRAFLETRLNGELLSDTLAAYTSPSGVYLPLGELSRMLDLAIMIDPPQRKASGWIIEHSRSFELDLIVGTAATSTAK